jgi:DNA replication protein DnaC
MKNLPLLDEHLRTLRLPAILANYRRIADDDADKLSYLHELAALEVDKRHENGVRARIAAAHFPVVKTMESCGLSHKPQVPKTKKLDILAGRVGAEKRNLILVGPTGVGKTHALISVGLAACTAGYRVLFATAAELCMTLIAAKREDRLKQRLAGYERYHLVLIDELGYIPFEREATDLLYQVVSQRYERASLGLTTNLAFMDWTQVFPDPMTASAVVDRLVHHGMVFEFSGESHRLRTRQAAGRSRKAS